MQGCKAFNRSWGAGSPHVSLAFEDHTLELLVQSTFLFHAPGLLPQKPGRWKIAEGVAGYPQLARCRFPFAFHHSLGKARTYTDGYARICQAYIINWPLPSLATQATLYFRSLQFTKSALASRLDSKSHASSAANSFLDSKGDRRDGQFVMTHMTDQLASGKLPVMWFCTVHEAQQAPYTWWAQQVASSTVMANKSCSSLADAFSLHLEAADVASYMRRERASFATRGKLWKLWTHFSHTCLEEMMTKYDTAKYYSSV